MIKIITALIIMFFLNGCGTTNLYKGEARSNADLAKVWNTNLVYKPMPSAYIRILKIDDHQLTTSGGREYALLPGEYNLEIFYQRALCGGPNCITVGGNKTYHLKLKMEAGQTYLAVPSDSNVPPKEACILGEPHDAEGTYINITKEFRAPSKNAKIIVCSESL